MTFELVADIPARQEASLVEFALSYRRDLEIIENWVVGKDLSKNSSRAMRFEARRWLCWLLWHHSHETTASGFDQPFLKRANSLDGAAYFDFLKNPQPIPEWALQPMYVRTAGVDGGPAKTPTGKSPWRLEPDLGAKTKAPRPGERLAVQLPAPAAGANIGLSKASYTRAKALLRVLYSDLMDMHFDDVQFNFNPIPKPSRRSKQAYATKKPRKKAIGVHERSFIDAALDRLVEDQDPQEPQIRWIWMALTQTGLRRSELAAATTADLEEDVDDNDEVGWELQVCGKGEVDDVIPLNPVFLEEFRRYRLHHGLSPMPGLDAEGNVEATPLVIPFRGEARHVSSSMIYRYMKQLFGLAAALAKTAGDDRAAALLLQFAAHSARHTFVTTIANLTKDVATAQAAARHSSVDTTMGYITKSKNTTRRAVEAMGVVLRPDRSST